MANRIYISFSSPIDQATSETLLSICANQIGKYEEVYLLLSTTGGNVINGVNIYNVLKSMPFKLITHNVGAVNSIGNVIFLAGSTRYACVNSSFMFHGVGVNIANRQFEEKSLKETLDTIVTDQNVIADIVSQCTGYPLADTKRLFLNQVTKRPEEAKDMGMIQEIRDVTIPKGAQFIQIVFQR